MGRERLSQRVQLDISPLAGTEDASRRIRVPETFSVEKLNVRTPTVARRSLSDLQHLKDLRIPELSGEVEVLLGANVLEAVLQREARVGRPGEPVAIRTAFGWALTGSLTGLVPEHVREVMFISTLSDEKIKLDLSDWWSTESLGTSVNQPALTPDDRKAMDILEKTTKRKGDKYEVGLLWQDEGVQMPDNYTMACNRLKSLERTLRKNPERAEAYCEVMESYVQQGYARRLTPEEIETKEKKRWILPHHAVVHPEKPKPRVVFDAAAQSQGTSLNSELLKSPDLLQSLHGVLLRFRQEPYAVVADIFQMFHQISVRTEDQPAMSFLWRELDDTRPPDLYQMLVVIFGSKCSPCIANYVLRRTLEDDTMREGERKALVSSFYVDDFVRAEETPHAAVATIKEVTTLLSQGGFRLTKWISSHPELLRNVSEEDQDSSQKKLTSCEGGSKKLLGCVWSPEEDSLSILPRPLDVPATKRGVVRMAATIFDPLGFVSPYMLQVKLLIQKLWVLKLDWDEGFSGPELSWWQSWMSELQTVEELRVPRCLKPSKEDIVSIQLHLFSDASESAFAAVCYVRMTDTDGRHSVSLVMSRSRVAPLKQLSIVRLEL